MTRTGSFGPSQPSTKNSHPVLTVGPQEVMQVSTAISTYSSPQRNRGEFKRLERFFRAECRKGSGGGVERWSGGSAIQITLTSSAFGGRTFCNDAYLSVLAR